MIVNIHHGEDCQYLICLACQSNIRLGLLHYEILGVIYYCGGFLYVTNLILTCKT